MILRIIMVCCLFLNTFNTQASKINSNIYDCFELAGRDANIDPILLKAIAWQESGLNYKITGSNAILGFGEGHGYGLMQIDSQHLQFLKQYGITRENLINDICLNIYVGTYFMALAFNEFGENWDAVGAYNAGFKKSTRQHERRTQYARKVHATYKLLKSLK